ncbi:carbonate dehydratase [Psittacicella hinzii]|uniref:Carbonic anhydrase n=1 Tax=Psittacicella hinzii TaxID=2028575 RepID=A0A3A1Y5K4_9GAMM|nr:carbonate dehydratase [Psittacicella hinzii]RIY32488.1 carbonate dehydratase [Psittacicella hinzii]
MDKKITEMLRNNQRWARKRLKYNPNYFKDMAEGQTPDTLWIGCSDSRVPAEILTGNHPGQLFVHRNIANMVIHTDLNCMSVVQYAVEVLKVKDIVVCGHTNCGGIKAAADLQSRGLISNWLMHIQDLYSRHQTLLNSLNEKHRLDVVTRLNVAEQIWNLGRSSIIKDAWARGQDLTISGLVYDIEDGHLLEEGVDASNSEELEINYRNYIARLLTLTDQDLDQEAIDRIAKDKLAEDEEENNKENKTFSYLDYY